MFEQEMSKLEAEMLRKKVISCKKNHWRVIYRYKIWPNSIIKSQGK